MRGSGFLLGHAVVGGVVAVILVSARVGVATPTESRPTTPGPTIGIRNDPHDSQPGVLVDAVRTGSPADVAGLNPGDRIERIDGELIQDRDALQRAVQEAQPGVTRTLTVRRGGVAFDVNVAPRSSFPETEPREKLFAPSYRISCVLTRDLAAPSRF